MDERSETDPAYWLAVLSEADSMEEAIGLAIGAASVCWENPGGAGVFESGRAAAISAGLLELVRGYVR